MRTNETALFPRVLLNDAHIYSSHMKSVFIWFGAILLSSSCVYAGSGDEILGIWLNAQGDGYIEISKNAKSFEGVIVGSPNPDGAKRVDINNPEPKRRSQSLLGLKILSGFSFDGVDRWTGGQIYDPNNGKTYRCNLELIERDTMAVRGYVGIPLFGRTETWTRKE